MKRKVSIIVLCCLTILAVALYGCGKKTRNGSQNVSAENSMDETTQISTEKESEEESESEELTTEEDTEDTKADGSDEDNQTEEVVEVAADNNSDEQTEAEAVNTEQNTQPETSGPEPVVICIDPGHGGDNEGTKETYDGTLIMEKYLNYRIAQSLKSYLEQYDNVKVVMTRDSDVNPSFSQRVNSAISSDARYIISVHVNSRSSEEVDSHGCMVLMSCSRYQPSNSRVSSLYDTEYALAKSVLSKLNAMGIPIANDWNTEYTEGILQRTTTSGETYPDGSQADYYSLLYNGTRAGIPTIIIEHAFLSNENDYRNFLSTDAKLDALAKADAEGIMESIR